jgi:hypothetical protein
VRRPIFPLGQIWVDPPPAQIRRFRQLAAAYGATGVSWWSWQSASSRGWQAVGRSLAAETFLPTEAYPILKRGARGDLVVWAQQHLVAAGQAVVVNGVLGLKAKRAVSAFQAANGLLPSGTIDAATWRALLRYPPAEVPWAARARAAAAARSSGS